MLEQQIEQDIKTAQLAGDALRLSTLRGLKASLLNVKVATGKRASGLNDAEVLQVAAKQSKQRQESADMYVAGGDQTRAEKELAEKEIIDAYLPAPLSEAEISSLIIKIIAEINATGLQAMGQVIGQAKQRAGVSADGAVIARLVREKLS